jgi:AcrR family transcriptional regulator
MNLAQPDPPKTPKAAATRSLLLELGSDLFIEHGYHAVSLRDIADAAGLTKGAIYGHFRSKGQLLVEVIRTELAQRDEMFDPDSIAAGADAVDSFVDADSRDLRMLQVDAAAAARHDPDVAAGLSRLHKDRQAMISATLPDRLDRETMAFVIASLASGVGMQEAVGVEVPELDRWRAAILPMLAASLAKTRS